MSNPFEAFGGPPSGSNIPIIGQSFVIKGGFVMIVGQCKCNGEENLVTIANGPGVCPSCHKMWMVMQADFNAQTGQIRASVQAIGIAGEQPKGEPCVSI